MGYTVVKSFERGIDTRKLIDTTEPGTLLEARDCHITLGGELEKRAAFVVKATLPAETVGLWVTQGRVYNTWGDTETPPAGLPPGTVYHYIFDPTGAALVRVLAVEEFNSKLYVVALFANNAVLHFFDDKPVVVTPPEVVDGGGPPPTTTPANKPSATMGFGLTTLPEATPDVILKAIYLLAPASTRTWGTDAWLIIPQTGTDAGGAPIGNTTIVGPGTAGDIAAGVMAATNAFVPPGTGAAPVTVSATVSGGATVLFWINHPGALYNGWKVEVKFGSTRATALGSPAAFNGGTDAVTSGLLTTPLAIYPGDVGDPIEKGDFVIAHNTRMFATQGTLLNFSAPRLADEWTKTSLNAGNINHSWLTNRKPELISMADYGGDLAVFGTRHIFVWNIDVIPSGDFKKQALHGTGTFAPHSVVPYGQSDVMYLDISGIRSLRARDSSEQAFAADIGNLIDDLVRTKVDSLTADQKKYNIWGIVEPRSGRLWMALLDQIFVLSFYPSSRIAAWTWYDATEAPVDMMNSSDNSVYWRSGDDIMIYGDESGTVFDDTEALARIPYIDGGKPATHKNWTGIDLAVSGTWQVKASFDPTVPTALDLVANITKSTYAQQKIAMNGESPGISLELRSTFVGPARVGNAALHYTDSTSD